MTGGGKLVGIDGLDSHLFHGSNRELEEGVGQLF